MASIYPQDKPILPRLPLEMAPTLAFASNTRGCDYMSDVTTVQRVTTTLCLSKGRFAAFASECILHQQRHGENESFF